MVLAIDVVPSVLYLYRCVANERDTALPSVGVSGELEIHPLVDAEIVEGIWLVDEGDDRGVPVMTCPGWPGRGVATPDGVKTGHVYVFAFDRKHGSGVLKVIEAS